MATPITPAGTAAQLVNVPPPERDQQAETVEANRAEESRAVEPNPEPRRNTPDPDSNLGNNIDTTA